ncbi:MAG: SDR family NAD(P)-dependent oxidoreductase [bacterium]
MARRFEGQGVVITGASAGIGEAAARGFAAEGAHVLLVARGVEKLEAVAASIRAGGGQADIRAADVGDPAACRRIIEAAASTLGRLDVLVNNAALHHRGAIEEVAPEALAEMVDVNLRSPIYLTCLALPHLRARGGAVVQVASLAGCTPTPGAAVYSATKFGLRAFSRALALELQGAGVRFSIVSPGPVDTGFIMDDLEHVADVALSQPISTAAEVAAAILDSAADGRLERRLPVFSGFLAQVAYLYPGVARRLQPALARKGARVRQRLLGERGGKPST